MTEKDEQLRTLELAESLSETVSRIDKIAGYGEETRRLATKTRRLVKGLFAVSVVGVILTAALVFFGIKTINNSNEIHNNRVTACHKFNQIRAEQISLWKFTVSLIPQEKLNSTQTKELNQLRSDVAHLYQPVNCSKIN